MSRVVVDAVLRRTLEQVTQPVELCDESGAVLGRFVPDLSQFEPLEPQVNEEELERRQRSSDKRYTTAEVLASLEKL